MSYSSPFNEVFPQFLKAIDDTHERIRLLTDRIEKLEEEIRFLKGIIVTETQPHIKTITLIEESNL